jgi:apolipoprotein N-acyltransferase
MLRKINPIFLCLLSGILLALPFNNGKLWIFAWAGFIPAFFALNNKSRKEAFFLFFITGIIFWWATIYWLVHVTLAGTIVLVLYLALYFAIFGLIIRPCTKQSGLYALVFIPSVWVLLEYIRGHLLTGFPWAILGYSQYRNLAVIQVADITGAWGVSFLLILANTAIVEIIWLIRERLRTRLSITVVLLALSLFITLYYGYYKINRLQSHKVTKSQVKISVIQGNIPQELKWDPRASGYILEKYFALTKQALVNKAELIVWPEAALPIVPQENPQSFEEVRYFVKDSGIPLLLGAVTADTKFYYNSGLLISGAGEVLTGYNKIHLVPFGEYIPLRKLLPFLETIVPIGDVERGKEYAIFKIRNQNFSLLICFEDVFPELSRRFVKQGADFLVNITNDGWYKETPAAYQHLQASVFRAVENRVSIVRSANTGVSAFINPLGKITATVSNNTGKEIFVDGYKTAEIDVIKKPSSFYTRFGDAFILACLFFVIYGIITSKKVKAYV